MKTYTIRYAVFCCLISAFFLGFAQRSEAVAFTAGPTLTGSPVTSETNALSNGVTVQFTLDSSVQVTLDFFQVAQDASLTQVASLSQSASAGVSKSIFWNALWLIGTNFGRHDGTFLYQVTPTGGTPLPAPGDPSALFQINSVDIHNLTVTPSLDASQQPTFPFTISYALAKTALVTATISNSSGTVVRTLISRQRQAGEVQSVSTETITWNGLTDAGKIASIGTYSVTINAVDPDTGDLAIPRAQSFSVVSLAGAAGDPQKSFEDNVFVYPNPVRNGQATFQMEAIRDGANLSLKIYTITGTLVRSESFPGVPAGNVQPFSWDGTNQSGHKVGRGLYYYVVREDDSSGTLQTVKKMAVIP